MTGIHKQPFVYLAPINPSKGKLIKLTFVSVPFFFNPALASSSSRRWIVHRGNLTPRWGKKYKTVRRDQTSPERRGFLDVLRLKARSYDLCPVKAEGGKKQKAVGLV